MMDGKVSVGYCRSRLGIGLGKRGGEDGGSEGVF